MSDPGLLILYGFFMGWIVGPRITRALRDAKRRIVHAWRTGEYLDD